MMRWRRANPSPSWGGEGVGGVKLEYAAWLWATTPMPRDLRPSRSPGRSPPPLPLPTRGRGSRRALRQILSPARGPKPILPSLSPTEGASRGVVWPGRVRCSWGTTVAGRTPSRGFVARVDHNPVREGRNARRKHQREPRAGRGGCCWRCFDTTFDIDIGTQPSTATPPSSRASPRIRFKTRKPRGREPAGAFGAMMTCNRRGPCPCSAPATRPSS
ncbi:hypothetical protein BSY19_854 [Bosea sp. RAC05]|nr:hypothetical protein BSY19_854 [Bosea sp. RAC05]